MDEFNIPLSLVYDLAINQSAQYYLEARHMAGFEDPLVKTRHPNYRKSVYVNEMKYWDTIFRTLSKLREELE